MRSRLRFWPTTLVGSEDPVVAHPAVQWSVTNDRFSPTESQRLVLVYDRNGATSTRSGPP